MNTVNPRWAWLLPVIVALGMLTASAFSGYTRNDKTIAERITTVEVQQKNDTKAIDRIDTNVKSVDGKVDRVSDKVDQILREMRGSRR